MAIEVTRHFDMAIRWSVHFENMMISVQRLQEFADLEPEENQKIDFELTDKTVEFGEIHFQDVRMQYQKNLKPALDNVQFKIEAGKRIAIVGRTGAGKSSLYQLLSRFRSPTSGQIVIDNQDIAKIPLENLRSEIDVVLQHPFILTCDTIRKNLDPNGEFKDEELDKALDDAAFYHFAETVKQGGEPEDSQKPLATDV